jgi:hypothetical protein
MNSRLVGIGAVVAVGALFLGSGEQTRTSANAALIPASARPTPPTTGEPPPAMKRGRFREATVYVDGDPRGILRALEMPPSLKTHAMASNVGSIDRYYVAEYLQVLGVDIAKVKTLHFYGGRRIAVVSGSELRRFPTTLSFEFAGGDRGKPRMHFPGGDFQTNTSVDMISGIAVYVDKEAPRYINDGGGAGYLAFADGKAIEGVPYAPEEQLKGTRVYVDGVLVSTLKRKLLPNELLLDGYGASGPAPFSLAKYLDSIGASTKGARAIDLITGDDVVQRIDGKDWDSQKKTFAFTIPARSQGQLVIDIPSSNALKAKISTIQIFARMEPPKRWIAPPEFVAMADAPGGSGDGDGIEDAL